MNPMWLRAEQSFSHDAIRFYCRINNNVLTSGNFVPQENEGSLYDPFLQIKMDEDSIDALKQLMTDLWNMGLRPLGIASKDEAIINMAKHLEDMRHIAFGQLKQQLPEGDK